MATLSSFNFVTLNGFYKGSRDDISWHRHDDEGVAFSVESMKSGNSLIMGRVTYEMMHGFWSSPQGYEFAADVAKGMNDAEKLVFSRTLRSVNWNNARLVEGDLVEEVRKLKQGSARNMTILGSGSIVAQLAQEKLIDDIAIMVDPVAIPSGIQLFSGMEKRIDLELVSTRTFKSGAVLLRYRPV